jgi:hypothetical protein
VYIIGCPGCGYRSSLRDFGRGCADECSCPRCDCFFQLGDGFGETDLFKLVEGLEPVEAKALAEYGGAAK